MNRRRHDVPPGFPLILVLIFMTAAVASGTELRGSLSYDGRPVSVAWPEMTQGSIRAFNLESHQAVVGSVDPTTNSYSLDLPEGTYNLRVIVGPDSSADDDMEVPGNLVAYATNVIVPSEGTVTVDLAMYYLIHIVAPYDNDDNGAGWGGSLSDCPFGRRVSPYFRLEWEEVRGVEFYDIIIQHYSCPDPTDREDFNTTDTFLDVSIDPSGPDTFWVAVVGYGENGALTTMPSMNYDYGTGSVQTNSHWLHTDAGDGRPIHLADSVFILQAARLPGVGASFWTTDLTLANPEPNVMTIEITLTPRNTDGLADFVTKTFTVPASGCRTIKDVIGTLFGLETGVGSLQISPASLRVWARTATTGETGTFGQYFPSVDVGEGPSASLDGGETLSAAGIIRGTSRTNLALAEVWGAEATVEVTLLDADGTELGRRSYDLPPYGNIQLNDVVKVITGNPGLEIEDAQVRLQVTDGGGKVSGSLSIVASGSNDPITVMLE